MADAAMSFSPKNPRKEPATSRISAPLGKPLPRKRSLSAFRVITFRTGVVLGKGGQAYEKLMTVFKFGIGGRLGDGEQWMPWIHVEDLRRAMLFSIRTEALTGAVNGTAPEPERNKDLTKKLAKAVHRWEFFPVPGFMLKLVLGGFGGALLVGQRAVPEKLGSHGFAFKYPESETALKDLTAAE